MIELLLKTIEEYNELQTNEEFTLDWWDDVISTLQDRDDEEEIAEVIDTVKQAIEKLR